MKRKGIMPVILSSYRLEQAGEHPLGRFPPPRDWLSSGGQRELISWWFVPHHIHGTSSSTPMLRYNRSALAVTYISVGVSGSQLIKLIKSVTSVVLKTSRERPKSAPYLRLKNSKRTSKCQVFSSTVPA